MTPRWLTAVVIFFAVTLCPVVSSAEEGYFVGAAYSYHVFQGDIKNFPGSPGPGLFIGYHPDIPPHLRAGDEQYDLIFSYMTTRYHFSSGDAVSRRYGLDMRCRFLTSFKTQPYVLLGIGYHTLEDSFVNVGGAAFNVGAGIEQWMGPRFSIGAGAVYHKVEFNNVKVNSSQALEADGTKGDGYEWIMTGAYHF